MDVRFTAACRKLRRRFVYVSVSWFSEVIVMLLLVMTKKSVPVVGAHRHPRGNRNFGLLLFPDKDGVVDFFTNFKSLGG
jgi:hypothetical protein